MNPIIFDTDLNIESDAFNALPSPVQEFLKNKLNLKWAAINGWSWCDIKWVFDTCVKLCFNPHPVCSLLRTSECEYIPSSMGTASSTPYRMEINGSPSRDIGITWVYNTATNQYEEWITQYHPPVSLLKKRKVFISFDDFLANLNDMVDFDEIDSDLEPIQDFGLRALYSFAKFVLPRLNHDDRTIIEDILRLCSTTTLDLDSLIKSNKYVFSVAYLILEHQVDLSPTLTNYAGVVLGKMEDILRTNSPRPIGPTGYIGSFGPIGPTGYTGPVGT